MPKRPLTPAIGARQLHDLGSVGAATLRDFAALGITSVAQLATRDADELYAALNERYHTDRAHGLYTGVAGLGPDLDICVLDTLHCAIAQARDTDNMLPAEQRQWWWYSRQRKQAASDAKRAGEQLPSGAVGAAAAPGSMKQSRSDKSLPGGVVHELPADLRKALSASAAAAEVWVRITPLARNEFICWVSDAKRAETRDKRITRACEGLQCGKRRPCCWPGCKHR